MNIICSVNDNQATIHRLRDGTYQIGGRGNSAWIFLKENRINFEDELKKFHPSLEVEDVEDAIYSQDLTDIADLLIKKITELDGDLEQEFKEGK